MPWQVYAIDNNRCFLKPSQYPEYPAQLYVPAHADIRVPQAAQNYKSALINFLQRESERRDQLPMRSITFAYTGAANVEFKIIKLYFDFAPGDDEANPLFKFSLSNRVSLVDGILPAPDLQAARLREITEATQAFVDGNALTARSIVTVTETPEEIAYELQIDASTFDLEKLINFIPMLRHAFPNLFIDDNQHLFKYIAEQRKFYLPAATQNADVSSLQGYLIRCFEAFSERYIFKNRLYDQKAQIVARFAKISKVVALDERAEDGAAAAPAREGRARQDGQAAAAAADMLPQFARAAADVPAVADPVVAATALRVEPVVAALANTRLQQQ